jgi:hypothetical protein
MFSTTLIVVGGGVIVDEAVNWVNESLRKKLKTGKT